MSKSRFNLISPARVTTLAAAVLAALALSVPAFAQAEPTWHVNGVELTEEVPFESSGGIAWHLGEIGLCGVSGSGFLGNEAGHAVAIFTSYEIATPCPASMKSGCEMQSATTGTDDEEEWPVTVSSSKGVTKTVIHNERITASYPLGPCPVSTLTWGGSLEGVWDNGSGCIEYDHAGALKFIGYPNYSFLTNGEECLSVEGGDLTLG